MRTVFVLDVIEEPAAWKDVMAEVNMLRPGWDLTWTDGATRDADGKVRDTFHLAGEVDVEHGIPGAVEIGDVFDKARETVSERLGKHIPRSPFRHFRSWVSKVPDDV
jgi:hypothetical protein